MPRARPGVCVSCIWVEVGWSAYVKQRLNSRGVLGGLFDALASWVILAFTGAYHVEVLRGVKWMFRSRSSLRRGMMQRLELGGRSTSWLLAQAPSDLELSATFRNKVFCSYQHQHFKHVSSIADHISDYLRDRNRCRCVRPFCTEAGQGCSSNLTPYSKTYILIKSCRPCTPV